MGMRNETIKELQLRVEEAHKVKATFKETVQVKEINKDGSAWKGEVCVFHLLYSPNTRTAAQKATAEAWVLPKPSAAALERATKLGAKMRADFNRERGVRTESLHRAKLAYAWLDPAAAKNKPSIVSRLHQGVVKSPQDAVKAAIASG